jgi:hypothetical protein
VKEFGRESENARTPSNTHGHCNSTHRTIRWMAMAALMPFLPCRAMLACLAALPLYMADCRWGARCLGPGLLVPRAGPTPPPPPPVPAPGPGIAPGPAKPPPRAKGEVTMSRPPLAPPNPATDPGPPPSLAARYVLARRARAALMPVDAARAAGDRAGGRAGRTGVVLTGGEGSVDGVREGDGGAGDAAPPEFITKGHFGGIHGAE